MTKENKIFSDLEKIASSIPIPIFWADTNGALLGGNDLIFQKVGGKASELIGKTPYEYYPKEYADELMKNVKQVIEEKKLLTFEESTVDIETQKTKWWIATRAPLFDDDEETVIGTIGASLDITDRKESEKLRVETESQRTKLKEQEKLQTYANKVAHDIRSPLASLLMIVKSCQEIPESARIALREAASNIADIANGLLDKFSPQEAQICSDEIPQLTAPSLALLQIITGKKYQYQSHHVEFTSDFSHDGNFSFIKIQLLSFKRMISNIMNNAVESCENNPSGKVHTSLESENNQIKIAIQDNGEGLSKEIIDRIMKKTPIISHKKKSRGIGLVQVQEALECNNGKLLIDSETGKGTTMTLIFPKALPPDWFVDEIVLNKGDIIVVLDDDTSIHGAWDSRFKEYVHDHDITLKHFTSGKNAIEFINSFTNKNKIFLLTDFELLNQELDGLNVIKKTSVKRSILVTSHYNNQTVINLATKSKTKVLPKQLAPEISILINKIKTSENKETDIVIIDDSKMLTDSFTLLFNSKNKTVDAYNDPAHFLENFSKYNKDTIMCLDNDLNHEIKGLDLAKKLHKAGYTKLYMISGSSYSGKMIPKYLKLIRKDDIDNLSKIIE